MNTRVSNMSYQYRNISETFMKTFMFESIFDEIAEKKMWNVKVQKLLLESVPWLEFGVSRKICEIFGSPLL